MNTEAFEKDLRKENYADNTIIAYRYAVKEYFSLFRAIGKENLLQYKAYLIERQKPKTVNLRMIVSQIVCPDR